jgi:hypothetical protein
VKVFNTVWAGMVVYLLAAVGLTCIAAQLSHVILVHAIVLAWPHLQGGPPKLSLIQQRRIDAALALPPSADLTTTRVVAVEAAAVPPGILATQLDLAEQADSAMALPQVAAFELRSEPSSIATEQARLRGAYSRPRYTQLTAADIFNRSFGVITTAAN